MNFEKAQGLKSFSDSCAFFIAKMKNKKLPLYFISTILLVLLISCKTTERNIYTFPQEEGQIVFLRQVTLDNKNFALRNSTFDVTVKIVDFQLTSENTVNYTVHLPVKYYSYIDDVDFFFQTEDTIIKPQNISILYKDFDKKKNLDVRYTGTISKEDLALMVKNPEKTKIGISIDNQTQLFYSQDFYQKLFELGILIR